MKVLLTGADGQLGYDLCRVLPASDLIPLTIGDVDITDIGSVKKVFRQNKPDIVINTAAYVRVDDCESHQDEAYQVNALGARNMAVAAQECGARLAHISTDYVFGGEGRTQNTPFTEFDTPVPLSVYGKSKLAGEDLVRHLCSKHFIIRTSGLFGVAGALGKGGNFIETMLRLGSERDELRVVNDQVFSPTYTADIARKIAQLVDTEYYGVFHVTNSGTCSWFEFTKEIIRQAGLKTKVTPITSDQYPQKARRPSYSVLDNFHLRLLGMSDMRPWPEALADYLKAKGHVK
ncbi:MAG: dTDP-4-dehydrorhamnose reductase, partial [Chloroflexi bacterium]|nr:dTDP-4-dehydrorhamnose reductase [Chloroflexota bacterium]